MALRREPVLLPGLVIQVREPEYAPRHMGPVESRLHIECRAERGELGPNRVHPGREVLPEEQLVVLVHLDRDECDPEEERGEQGPAEETEVALLDSLERSEERRVGKECRSRWSP